LYAREESEFQVTSGVEKAVFFRREDCAGFWHRVLVDVIDVITAVIAFLIIVTAASTLSPAASRHGPEVAAIALAAVWFFYFVLLKYLDSRTLGHALCGLRMVNLEGRRPSFWSVVLRATFAAAGPINWWIDLAWLGGDPQRQALRDKFAHTYVVKRRAQPLGEARVAYVQYDVLCVNLVVPEVAAPLEASMR
jgi:uncharacterized RDD family membrane protein YckC